jgi:flavin-dependent dehydrogenase
MVCLMSNRVRSVAILGGGPSGSCLGAHLARAGVRVGIYDTGKRPEIVVGESLVPAIVPYLQNLGIEEEVRSYSIYKPGATFVLRGGEEIMNLRFDEIRGAKTNYSYNVPRSQLDASFQRAAVRDGAKMIPHTGRVEVESDSERLRLTADSLEAGCEVFGSEQPDFIVDATGRRRMVANLLKIPHETGPRRDAALHAHLEGVGLIECGNVHTDLLETGWSWRIPLPGRVSVGLVIDGDTLSRFGDTNEEQFDNYLAYDPVIQKWGGTPRRTTRVYRYSNYQLSSDRGVGPNWALVGDAFGFVDPVFSSGMLIGLDGAETLAKAIRKGASERALGKYQARVKHHLEAWQKVVTHYYNGRLFTLFHVGDIARTTPMGRVMDLHFGRYLPHVFTGEASNGRYGPWLLDFMCRRALVQNDPSELAVA